MVRQGDRRVQWLDVAGCANPWFDMWAAGIGSAREVARWRATYPDIDAWYAAEVAASRPAWAMNDDDLADLVSIACRLSETRAEVVAAFETCPYGDVRVFDAREVPAAWTRGSPSPYFVVCGAFESAEKLGRAIVGTRRASGIELQWAGHVTNDAIEGFDGPIVSGGAIGVDAAAHRACVDRGHPTVAVLAGGIAHVGPRRNAPLFRAIVAAGGCLVTVDRPLAPPAPSKFVSRNQLIASMSALVVVAFAPARSGALSTAAYARALNVPVYAVPGSPWETNGEGCNRLLAGGARVWIPGALGTGATTQGTLDLGREQAREGTSAARHREVRPASERAAAMSALSDEARRVVEALVSGTDGAEAIALELGLDAAQMAKASLELELAAVAVSEPGGRLRLV